VPPDTQDLGQITIYLKRLATGDAAAEEPLADLVYVELQQRAHRLLHGKSPEFTLQPTALVNEVLLELIRLRTVDWQDREHFFRVASRLLRRRFVDYIRERRAQKRPPTAARVQMEELLLPSDDRFEEVLFVHEGLNQLADFDQPLAELVELVYFGGISISAIAEMRGVSEKTIDRHLDLARRWLESRFRTACPQIPSKSAIDT
jgi:RNA polymerase sigma factor (TIGR02999 family)